MRKKAIVVIGGLLASAGCDPKGESRVASAPTSPAPPRSAAAQPSSGAVTPPELAVRSVALETLAQQIRTSSEGAHRKRLLVLYLAAGLREGARLDDVDPALLDMAFLQVPASDPAWGAEPEALSWALPHVEGIEPFLESVVATNPDADVRAATLLGLARVAQQEGRPNDVRKLAARATQQAPKSTYTKRLAALDPQGTVVVGRPAPDFRLDHLSGSVPPTTLASLSGQLTLVVFWATWCGVCHQEMSALSALHAKYGERGFTVVAVSIDEERETVLTYRARNPAPWLDSWQSTARTRDLRARFEVVAVPTMVLIGRDGTVLAEGAEARTDVLAQALPQLIAG